MLDKKDKGKERVNVTHGLPTIDQINEIFKSYKYDSYITTPFQSSSPIDYAYINLRMITQAEAKQKAEAEMNMLALGIEYSEVPDSGFTDVEHIFNSIATSLPTNEESSEAKVTKKVAIYGKPGTGKSTLCQHMVLEWPKGSLWQGQFDGMILISLKDLVEHEFDDDSEIIANIAIIIYDKYCANLEDKPALEQIIDYLQDDNNAILFILDGYDEIKDSLNQNLKMREVLNAILTHSNFNVIITSRSVEINLGRGDITFDKVLENVGFTSRDIEGYINKQGFSDKLGEKLISFIYSNQSALNMASIPLNLYMLCQVWNTNFAREEIINITQLYERMIDSYLQIGDKQNKKGKEKVEAENLEETALRKEVLLKVYGSIAFSNMQNKRSDMLYDNFAEIIAQEEQKLNMQGLAQEALSTGIIKVIKGKSLNKIVFPHQTFQEYFAAQAVAKWFLGNTNQYTRAIELLKEHKYNPYYEVVWLRVVGILSQEYNKSNSDLPLIIFFDAFENEPRELVNITHTNLGLKLINECHTITKNEAIKNLKKKYFGFYETVIAFTDHNDFHLIGEIEKIAKQAVISERNIASLKRWMNDTNLNLGVKLYAAEAVLRCGYDSHEAIEILINVLKEPYTIERHYYYMYVVMALTRVNTKTYSKETETILVSIFESLENIEFFTKNFTFRGSFLTKYQIAVAEALIKIDSKSYIDQAINYLIKLHPKSEAVEALRRTRNNYKVKYCCISRGVCSASISVFQNV